MAGKREKQCWKCGHTVYPFLIDAFGAIREGIICPECGFWWYRYRKAISRKRIQITREVPAGGVL